MNNKNKKKIAYNLILNFPKIFEIIFNIKKKLFLFNF